MRAASVVLVNKTTLRCGGFNKPTHYRHGLRDGRFAARGFSVLGDGDLGFAQVVGCFAGGLASAGAIGSIPTERSRSRRPVVPTDAMGNLSADLTGREGESEVFVGTSLAASTSLGLSCRRLLLFGRSLGRRTGTGLLSPDPIVLVQGIQRGRIDRKRGLGQPVSNAAIRHGA